MGIPSSEQLLDLCHYRHAVEFIAQKGLAKKQNTQSGSDSDREDTVEFELPTVTMSVMQLCRKLRKMDHRFAFNFINEVDTLDADCVDKAEDADISPAKAQRMFVGDAVAEIYGHAI